MSATNLDALRRKRNQSHQPDPELKQKHKTKRRHKPNERRNLLDGVAQSGSGMLVEGFLVVKELPRTALSWHRSMDLLCQETQVAW